MEDKAVLLDINPTRNCRFSPLASHGSAKPESRWEAEVVISLLFLKLDAICFLVDRSIPHDDLHPTKMDAFFSVPHLQQKIIKQGQWRDAIWIQHAGWRLRSHRDTTCL
jgi:hypothetical protein